MTFIGKTASQMSCLRDTYNLLHLRLFIRHLPITPSGLLLLVITGGELNHTHLKTTPTGHRHTKYMMESLLITVSLSQTPTTECRAPTIDLLDRRPTITSDPTALLLTALNQEEEEEEEAATGGALEQETESLSPDHPNGRPVTPDHLSHSGDPQSLTRERISSTLPLKTGGIIIFLLTEMERLTHLQFVSEFVLSYIL
jgi:hypothetical protein